MRTEPFTVYLRKAVPFLASYLIHHFTVSVVNNHTYPLWLSLSLSTFSVLSCFVLGLPRGLCEPPAPCSGFCFFLLPPGILLQLCLQLGRCHLTGPPGPRSWERCLSLFHKKQNPLSEGETGNSAQRVQLSHFRKPSFLLWGKKLHTLSTTVKDQKAPLALDRVLHSWS